MIIIYLLTMSIVFILRSQSKTKFFAYPRLKIKDDGIYFNSRKRHRIAIGKAKVMQVNTIVYLQQGKIYITIHNIDRIYVKDCHLYFLALGEVKISCNMRRICKYFNIRIISDKLEFASMQTKAKNSLINHLFNIAECKELSDYISLVSRVLNIKFVQGKIVVSKNKYNIPYVLYYKVNNVIKKINILGV